MHFHLATPTHTVNYNHQVYHISTCVNNLKTEQRLELWRVETLKDQSTKQPKTQDPERGAAVTENETSRVRGQVTTHKTQEPGPRPAGSSDDGQTEQQRWL
ncbi:uncharacterized protein DS421_8g253100 [Arachis hypogaea]|nr:uncharacterized protein DS421_8g253100 [Arachis hypogaea]